MGRLKGIYTMVTATSILLSSFIGNPAAFTLASPPESTSNRAGVTQITTPVAKSPIATYKPGARSAEDLLAQANRSKIDQLRPVTADGDFLTNTAGNVRVIVELTDPPLTNFYAQLPPASQRSFVGPTPAGRLDANSTASLAYRAQLRQKQDGVVAAINTRLPMSAKLQVSYRYDVAFNGFAATLPQTQVDAARTVPGVKAIYPDREEHATMDASLPLIGAPTVWDTISVTLGITEPGRGVKVAVVDSGIDPANPFFANTGVYTYPAGFGVNGKGYCADHPGFCNGKIIAARYYTPTTSVNVSETLTPLGANGHGTHVAGTIAGNLDTEAHVGSITATVSGVAPFAYLMAYKGLWLTVDGSNASGDTSGLLAAINDAVADGADVINNSWGSSARSGDPSADPSNIAAVNATNAGVVVVWAAGNDGPSPNTVQDEGADPRLLSVAATSTGRAFVGELQVASNSVTVPSTATNLLGMSIGAGAAGAHYVDVGNITSPLPAGSLTGKVCLVTRGTIARVLKSQYCKDAGAISAVLRNDWTNASAPDDLEMDLHVIPTIQLHKAESAALTNWLNSLGTLTSTVIITVGPGIRNTTFDPKDQVADFSSRGVASSISVLKPDLSAPGVNILSSYIDVNDPGAHWTFLGGTSMAAPHVAGSAALLLSAHSSWYGLNDYRRMLTVKSALMNTAYTSVTVNGGAAATLEDMGAGRISLPEANDPGIVFDPPSYSFGKVSVSGEKVFTVTNVSSPAVPLTFTFSATKYITSAAYTVSATPATLVVPAGGSAVYTLTVNTLGLATGDYEGQVYWTEEGGPRVLHVPYWFRRESASFEGVVNVDTPRDQGEKSFSGIVGDPFLSTTATLYGLASPQITLASATGETDQSATAHPLDTSKGWYLLTYTVPSNVGRLVISTGNANVPDVDLYVLYDFNGDGYDFASGNPSDPNSDVFARSAGATANEVVDLVGGAGTLLKYLGGKTILIAVYNYTDSAASFKVRTWGVTPLPDASLSLSDFPSSLSPGESVTPTVHFSKTMTPGETYYGMVNLGNGADETAIAQVLVNVHRTESEVTKTVWPATAKTGDIVTYTITLQNLDDASHTYALTDVLPAGVTFIPGSLHGPGAVYDSLMNAVIINADIAGHVKLPNYAIQNNFDVAGLVDSSPFGGFIDLPGNGYNVYPFGDNVSGNFDTIGCAFNWYDTAQGSPTQLGFSSNGLFFPRGTSVSGGNTASAISKTIPSTTTPNGFLAAYWDDLAEMNAGAVLTPSAYSAVSAGACPNKAFIVQLDNAYRVEDPAQVLNVQLQYDSNFPDEYWLLYGAISGTLTTGVVGTENLSGTEGAAYTGPIVPGLVLRFYRPFAGTPVTITFQARVTGAAPATVVNELNYTVNVPGTGILPVSAEFTHEFQPAYLVISADPDRVPADGTSVTTLSATLKEAGGAGVPGVNVSFVAVPPTDVTTLEERVPALLPGEIKTHLNAVLKGSNEVPPTGSTATGMATFSYVPAVHKLFYRLEQSGMVNITMAHIHTGTVGVNGGVLNWLCDSPTSPGPAGTPSCSGLESSGVVTGVVTLTAAEEAALYTGGLYVNIHSVTHPGGEIRGQIVYPPMATTDTKGTAMIRMSSLVPGTQLVVAYVQLPGVQSPIVAAVRVEFTPKLFMPFIIRSY